MVARRTVEGGAQSRGGETRDQAIKRHNAAQKRAEKGSDTAGTDAYFPEIDSPDELERLNKVLARSGVASRRHVDEMIAAGRVKVNGETVTELGTRVNIRKDRVQVDGRRISAVSSAGQLKVYFLLNKPAGVLTTASDDRGRKTVLELVAGAHDSRIYPVGRLDYDAEGALLLTNDGELAAALMHPRTHVPKVYRVKVKGVPAESALDLLRRGIHLEDGPTRPCEIQVLGSARVNTWLEVVLREGKNRQLKRMFWRIKHPVLKIQRVTFGGVELGDLQVGRYRPLTDDEVATLMLSGGREQAAAAAREGKAPRTPAPGKGGPAPRGGARTGDRGPARGRDQGERASRDGATRPRGAARPAAAGGKGEGRPQGKPAPRGEKPMRTEGGRPRRPAQR